MSYLDKRNNQIVLEEDEKSLFKECGIKTSKGRAGTEWADNIIKSITRNLIK